MQQVNALFIYLFIGESYLFSVGTPAGGVLGNHLHHLCQRLARSSHAV